MTVRFWNRSKSLSLRVTTAMRSTQRGCCDECDPEPLWFRVSGGARVCWRDLALAEKLLAAVEGKAVGTWLVADAFERSPSPRRNPPVDTAGGE
jgi:hypothetical protein